jgi:hypothetical protein
MNSEFPPDEPIAAGDERASTGPRRRRHLTAMGVLEVLMWCAGAGALVAFWLWSRPTDVPGFGKATLERARPPVVLPGATATAQPDANLEVWQERFRAATTKAVQDHEPDPASTGRSQNRSTRATRVQRSLKAVKSQPMALLSLPPEMRPLFKTGR